MTDPIAGARWRIIQGDCLPLMRELADASVDAVVTDPPYGLSHTRPLPCGPTWAGLQGATGAGDAQGRGMVGESGNHPGIPDSWGGRG